MTRQSFRPNPDAAPTAGITSRPQAHDHSEALELVQAAAAGDPSAQQRLVERLHRRVRGIALSILGNAVDAEDATQAILVEILHSAGTFRGTNLLGWADRIAARTAIRHARQRRMRAMQCEIREDIEDVGVGIDPHPMERELPRPLLEYLAQLPETRRVAVVLHHVMDYSVEEIATMTEVSPNTVKDRLLQGRAQLRRLIRRDQVLTMAGRAS